MSKEGKGNISTAFLNKLWKLVNDNATNYLIKWSLDGTSFIITDQTRFAQELVPKYFKHNNMASFIRQLNLYGFRKVISLESGALAIDKGEIEFSHPKFIRGQPNLIENIKRKPQGSRVVASAEGNGSIDAILAEVHKLKMNQNAMTIKMNDMKKENDVIWRAYSSIRQKLSKQQHIIEKLVRFLLSMVKSPGQHLGGKWKFNHLALEGVENSAPKNIGPQNMSLEYESSGLLPITGPVIHEVTHLDEDNQILSLDKIFLQSSNGSSATSTPKSHAHNLPPESRLNDPICKVEALESLVLGDGYPSSLSRFPEPDVATYDPLVNNNKENSKSVMINEPVDFDPLQLIIENKSSSNVYSSSKGICTVQSPNGTFLNFEISPPLSPELLQTVDPSEISPNIIVNIPNENTQTVSRRNINTTSSDTSRTARGQSWVRKSDGKGSSNTGQKLNFKSEHRKMLSGENFVSTTANDYPDYTNWNRTSSSNVDTAIPDISNGSTILKASKGKNWSKNGKIDNSGQFPNSRTRHGKLSGGNVSTGTNNYMDYFSSDHFSPENKTSTSFDVAVPEKSVGRDELINHLDDVQLSLDSLKDMLSTSNLNVSVDVSTLLSLFGNEDESLAVNPEPPIANDSDILGNEVSVYNPSLYDITADNLNFGSLVDEDDDDDDEEASPSKKLRLDTFHENQNNDDEGFTTPQPQQFSFNFKTN